MPDTLFDGGAVKIEGKGLAGATGCTFSCKDITGKEHSTTYAGTGSDFSASDTLVKVYTASIVSEMRSWCVEDGSDLDTEAGATVKLPLADGSILTYTVTIGG